MKPIRKERRSMMYFMMMVCAGAERVVVVVEEKLERSEVENGCEQVRVVEMEAKRQC